MGEMTGGEMADLASRATIKTEQAYRSDLAQGGDGSAAMQRREELTNFSAKAADQLRAEGF